MGTLLQMLPLVHIGIGLALLIALFCLIKMANFVDTNRNRRETHNLTPEENNL